MQYTKLPKKFNLGKVVITPGISMLLEASGEPFSKFINKCLNKHICGNWGEICDEDKETNEDALVNNLRLMSVYTYNGELEDSKIWVITEADRSVTTLLLPEEY